MRKLITAAALVLVSTAAFAGDLPDYSDKSEYTCDKDTIEEKMTDLAENGRAGKMGVTLVYIKSASEASRKKDELRCKVVAVYSIGTVSGIFRWVNQDGHALVGFKPGSGR